MDPWILLRWPLYWIRFWVKRVGWKPILIGWVLCLPAIYVLEKVIG